MEGYEKKTSGHFIWRSIECDGFIEIPSLKKADFYFTL